MQDILDHFVKKQIRRSYEVKRDLMDDDELCLLIKEVSQKCVEVYKNGNKTLIAGNGGSAADAQHIAGEFVGRFYLDRPALPSIALTTDTSVLTAIGNDYGYERVFARQIEASGVRGDMFIGISTSGNSQNIIEALLLSREKGIITLGLTSKSGGRMEQICDYCLKVPSTETPRVQECHILIGHIICSIVEKVLFGEQDIRVFGRLPAVASTL